MDTENNQENNKPFNWEFPKFTGIKEKIKRKVRVGFSTFLLLNLLVAAVVGALFGYWAANLSRFDTDLGSVRVDRSSRNFSPSTSDEAAVINVVNKSTPAAVSIAATKEFTLQQRSRSGIFEEFCDDPFFRNFLGPQCDGPSPDSQPQTRKQQVSAGTGFLVSSDGLIVTNKHVIDFDGAEFTILTGNGSKYSAKVLAKDPFNDLALIKINGDNFPTLPLGDSDKLQIGQTVIAIGNALGEFSNTVSRGVVSGLSRSIVAQAGASSEKLDQLIQTDAAINPGNSGGPLLNLRGEVVGINTAIAQGAQSVGFAIPVNQIKKAINDVKSFGRIVYPFVGVRYAVITPEIKTARNLSVDYGVLVFGDSQNPGIVPGSPAEKAGLKEGDILLELNGQKLTVKNDLAQTIQKFKVGERVTLKILREKQNQNIEVVLEEKK